MLALAIFDASQWVTHRRRASATVPVVSQVPANTTDFVELTSLINHCIGPSTDATNMSATTPTAHMQRSAMMSAMGAHGFVVINNLDRVAVPQIQENVVFIILISRYDHCQGLPQSRLTGTKNTHCTSQLDQFQPRYVGISRLFQSTTTLKHSTVRNASSIVALRKMVYNRQLGWLAYS